jgi:hypothetical protein
MNKFTKISTAVGAAGVSLAFFATTAAFADTTATNTGNHVTVDAGSTNNTVVGVTNNNTAVTTQVSSSTVNTGGNTANRNIGNTSITSGNSTVSNAETVSANTNRTTISGVGSNTADNDASLVNTGDRVDFNTGSRNSTVVGVSNVNNAYATQMAFSDINTGDNTANRNIGNTRVTSGNAGVSNVFGIDVNRSNTTISNVGAGNGNGGDLDVVNTGNHLRVNGGNTNNLVLGVSNYNNAMLSQMSIACVNTGDNEANRNIGLTGNGGTINSGNAAISNVFSATANSNTTGINGANLFNSGSDAIDLTNTGDHVTVNGGNKNNTFVAVANHNGLFSMQLSHSNVNTGYNEANRNIALTGAGASINSGTAALMAAMMANANSNWTSIL